MQIAFFAVAKIPANERGDSVPRETCGSIQRRTLPSGFMIGRQLCVVSCMFFIARVTSLDVDVDAGEETLWGVSVAWQNSSTPVSSVQSSQQSLRLLHGSLWRRPSYRFCQRLPTSSYESVLFWRLLSALGPGFWLGFTKDKWVPA
jgi:hypothetical protein